MAVGLIGAFIGIMMMAAAPNLIVLCVGLTTLNLLKSCFDLSMAAWISDRVPYARRGRVVGITETSWALSLLLGVSALGLITAASSWRVASAIGGVAVAVCAVWLDRRIRDSGDVVVTSETPVAVPGARMAPNGWLVPLSMFGLMGASQCLFVTFGAWLSDDFNFGASGIAAVGFALGAGELLSSIGSAKLTDRVGKERSVALGAGLMVPSALVLAGFDSVLLVGLVALAVFIIGFEFAVVSMLPIATNLFSAAPGKGFGLVIGAGTFGRGVLTFVATLLYEQFGVSGAALASIGCAVLSGITILAFNRGTSAV
jgi:predicted MFS family arabinose efflux permease